MDGDTAAIEAATGRIIGWVGRDALGQTVAYGLGCAPRGQPLTTLRGCGPAERCAACDRTIWEHVTDA